MGITASRPKAGDKAAVDPVCGMEVNPNTTFFVNTYRGKIYHFCSKGCLQKFEEVPHRYLNVKSSKPKGWWKRYLERLARSNEELFGGRPPCCH
jgi:YHS domain-containing protein